MTVLVACGEVPWERDVLAAAAAAGIDVRRCVDVAALLAPDAGHWVITSPALRGFAEKPLRTLIGRGARVVIVLDAVRPPWLAGGGFDVRALTDIDWAAVFADQRHSEQERVEDLPHGVVTLVRGASGGVGTTTVAAALALRTGAPLVEANFAAPALAFLLGLPQVPDGAHAADPLRVRRWAAGTLLELAPGTSAPEIAEVLARASSALGGIVVDAGCDSEGWRVHDIDADVRELLVTDASPLGVLRLCERVRLDRPSHPTVVLNRVRDAAVGGRAGLRQLCALVERETGVVPLQLPDVPQPCDGAWLRGDALALAELFPALAAVAQATRALSTTRLRDSTLSAADAA